MTDEELINSLRGWKMLEMDAAADRIEELTNTHWQVDALQQNALLNDALTRAEQAEAKLANAAQAMAETLPNWEARCFAIMSALGMDFGGYSEDVPDVGSWFEVTYLKNLARAEDAEAKLAKAAQALRWAARYYDKIHPFQSADYHFKDCGCDFCGADCARAALTELEKTE
jgi:hypothetical protein